MSAMSELDLQMQELVPKIKVTITTMDGEVIESIIVTAPSNSSIRALGKHLINMIEMNYDTEEE